MAESSYSLQITSTAGADTLHIRLRRAEVALAGITADCIRADRHPICAAAVENLDDAALTPVVDVKQRCGTDPKGPRVHRGQQVDGREHAERTAGGVRSRRLFRQPFYS